MKNLNNICKTCINARKQLTKEDYIACSLGISIENIPLWLGEFEEIAEGWADLRVAYGDDKSSGAITNNVMLTKGVKKCINYIQQ